MTTNTLSKEGGTHGANARTRAAAAERAQQACALARTGMTCAQIAVAMGVSDSSVHRWLQGTGLNNRVIGRATPAEMARIRELRAGNMTASAIGNAMGRGRKWVERELREAGLARLYFRGLGNAPTTRDAPRSKRGSTASAKAPTARRQACARSLSGGLAACGRPPVQSIEISTLTRMAAFVSQRLGRPVYRADIEKPRAGSPDSYRVGARLVPTADLVAMAHQHGWATC